MGFFNGPVTELPQRGGPKDYAPDGTWLQNKRVGFFYKERNQVLTEERVKKKGHLAHGEWRAELGKVEIIGKVGKFWQTTGHVENHKFLLYPEEAVSLLDKGDIEIYYGGLPLSLQECYATLLGDVPIEYYQVYNHLSRLGFVIFRHQPIDKLSTYEKRLRMENTFGENRSQRKKRKAAKDKETEAKISKYDATDPNSSVKEGDHHAQHSSEIDQEMWQSSEICDMGTEENRTSVEDCLDASSSTEAAHEINHQPHRYFNNEVIDQEPCISLAHSDFSTIQFPSLQPGQPCEFDRPSENLIPSGIELEKDKYLLVAPRYTPAPKNIVDTDLEFSHPSGASVLKVKANNWTEYKEQLRNKCDDDMLKESPVGHLWCGEITPLVKPSQAHSTASVLDRLKIIQNVNFKTNTDSQSTSPGVKIVYDVFKPDGSFSKTDPGFPAYRLCIKRHDEPCVTLADLVEGSRLSCDGVSLQWAVVDNGDISFYTFNGVDLPTDISLK